MSASLRIQRLHARLDAGTQPVLARLALQSLAAELDASVAGLAPQALLLVRRLGMQLPARALHQMPDSVLRQQLGRDGRARLAGLAARAARPALGEAPADAEAVLFADLAEMLACLARDALCGRLNRWWWRDLLGAGYPDWTLPWARQPQAGPAALGLLRAEPSLARQAVVILRRQQPTLVREMALWMDALEVQANQELGASRVEQAAPPAAQRERLDPARARSADAASPMPVAEPGIAEPQPAEELPPPAESHQSAAKVSSEPAVVLKPSLQAQVPHLPKPASPSPAPLSSEAWQPPLAQPLLLPLSQPSMAMRADEPLPATQSRSADRVEGREDYEASIPASIPHALQVGVPAIVLSVSDTSSVAPTRPSPARWNIAPHAPLLLITDTPPALDLPLWPQPQALLSRQARLLMLVNCLLGDGIYPDFTRPRDPGFPLPIWTLLPLLAEALIGPAARDDPLWPCLDQRGQALPHRPFGALASDWPLPVQALRPRRLRHAGRHSLQRWVAGYAERLRGRLQMVLGLPRARIGQSLQGPPARLWLSAAEIVVVFDLESHPVAWRLAGLDRDPGYLPSAGCRLRFCFD